MIAALRADVTYPGDPGAVVHRQPRPPCIVTDPAAADLIWIPAVAAQGWLIITRDAHITQHRAELAAVRDYGARMVTLAGAQATGTWAQLEIVMTQWRRLESLTTEPGPFLYAVTRTGTPRKVPLG